MSWLTRAQGNTRAVVPLLYLPIDFAGDEGDYVSGIKLSMQDIQIYFKRKVGETFALRNLVTRRGMLHSTSFEGLGAKEGFQEVIQTCGYSPADKNRLFVCFVVAPKGWVGGTIGIDNWVGDFGSTYPWPGRTGLQGRGLDIICGLADPAPSGEWWSDETREWRGAIAHELGHAICGLPHQWDSIMMGWWDYPTVGFLPDEIEKLRASPFLR